MPRITKEDKARNRQNIVEAAGPMFRSQAVGAVGIAELMKEAGLCHGGFYNHFASKDDLAAEACGASFKASLSFLDQALQEGADLTGPPLKRVVDNDLSVAHRDASDGGCPSTSLVIAAGRHSDTVQSAYATGVEGCLTSFAEEFAREHEGEIPSGGDRTVTALAPPELTAGGWIKLRRPVGKTMAPRPPRPTHPRRRVLRHGPRTRRRRDAGGVLRRSGRGRLPRVGMIRSSVR
ncbi:TetR/AcrR family transcriptional regulator [Streptomyces asiaticus]|uniref:TetR/AcrR family transcriptional regulator n=1 Tax=Streptomyces asiaticus TaxID=114695 RepID=UPI0037FF413C